MGQIIGSRAKPKRCNLSKLSQLGTPAAGEHILVSSDNSMNAAGQGNFDCYIEGNGQTAATELELKLVDKEISSLIVESESFLVMSNEVTGVQISNGKWTEQSARHIYLVPYTYKEGDVLKIKGHATNGSYYAFLTSDSHIVGDDVPFAIVGQTAWATVSANQEAEAAIPSNCTFIAINYYYDRLVAATTYIPQSISIRNKSIPSDLVNSMNYINQLGKNCEIQNHSEENTLYALAKQWNTDGSYGQTGKTRASLKIPAIGYYSMTVVIPSGYYAAFFYIDSNNASLGYVDTSSWKEGTVELVLNGSADVMANIKYGSAGTTNITSAMASSAAWNITKINPNKYAPAAPYSAISSINGTLNGVSTTVDSSQFQQGSIDAHGNIVSVNTRLTTPTMISISAGSKINVIANGQKYGIVTYSTNGDYESNSGLMTTDGTFDFPQAKKIRLIAAKTNDATITTSELLVEFAIISDIGLVAKVEALENNSGGASNSDSVFHVNIDKHSKIASLCRTHSPSAYTTTKYFVLAHITDTHAMNKAVQRSVDFLNDCSDIDCLVHTGDIQRKSYNDQSASGVLYNDIERYQEAVSSSEKPFLTVLGNHDQNGASDSNSPITLEKIYNRFMKPMVDKEWLTSGTNIDSTNYATYYYKDFSDYNIRFIGLNSFDPLYDGFYTSKGMDDNVIKYSPAQISFLINCLNSVPSGYHVIIALHTPYDSATGDAATIINSDWSSTTKVNAGSHGSGQPTLLSASPLLDVLTAYVNKESLTKSYTYSDSTVQQTFNGISVNADFTSANGVLAFMAIGHNHDDWIGQFQSHANIKCVCMAGSILTEPDSDLGRGQIGGTDEWKQSIAILENKMQGKSQDAINVYIVRTDLRKVYIVRVGADFTNDARERIITSFTY